MMQQSPKEMLDSVWKTYAEWSTIYRLMKRAEIRRTITSRKSVQEGKPDRISDLLEEAALEIFQKDRQIKGLSQKLADVMIQSTNH